MTAFEQAWNILKMRFQDYQDKAKNMKDDIDFRYAREHGDSNMMPSHEQDTVNQTTVDRLVHDKMQENMQQGRVGEQTTDTLESGKPLFVPRFDARAIHPKYTVEDQSKLPYSMSDIYTDTPPNNYYDPKNYDE